MKLKRHYSVLLEVVSLHAPRPAGNPIYDVVAHSHREATGIAIDLEKRSLPPGVADHFFEVNLNGISQKGLVWPWRKVGAL